MNITNTVVCNEQALKQLKRFSGKVYNRIFRRLLIFCNVFPLLGLPLAWMCRNNGLGFDVLLFFLSAILPLCFWNARAAYLRCIVDRKRRALQGVGEVTITMTDDDYAWQGGGMQTRVRWQALGSSYLFLGDGFAILEGQNPTAFVSSLSECGVDATELKEVLVRAGLKDYCLCCDRGWIRLVIFMLAGAVVGMLGSLTQNKGRGALPPEPACTLADDEAREGEALSSETERFAKSIAGADRVVVRKGGFGCCGDPDKAPVLCTLTDPSEIAAFGELFTFKDLGMNGSCLCCGYPGIDWWKGDRIVARTSVQHLKGLRWKGFYGDAQFTPEAEKALSAWFDAHKIEVDR